MTWNDKEKLERRLILDKLCIFPSGLSTSCWVKMIQLRKNIDDAGMQRKFAKES